MNTGNDVIRHALRMVRDEAGKRRAYPGSDSSWVQGFFCASKLIGKYDLHADPLIVMAAENEARFLMGAYLPRGSRS